MESLGPSGTGAEAPDARRDRRSRVASVEGGQVRVPALVVPFRGTDRRLIVCNDGTVWELSEKDNKVVAVEHKAAAIPQPKAAE